MARKRERDDGAGIHVDAAPKRRKKSRKGEGEDGEEVLVMAKQEPDVTPVEISEVGGEVGSAFVRGKKSGKKWGEGGKGVGNLDLGPVSDAEAEPNSKGKEKKKKKKQGESPSLAGLEDLQSVQDHGLVSSGEPDKKKKKKKNKEGVPETSTLVTSQTSEIVEEVGLVSGAELQRKKKKTKEVTSAPVTLEASQVVEDGQEKKKRKKKKEEEVAPTPVTVDSSQIVGDGKVKKKNKTKKDVAPSPVALDSSQIVEDGQGKKKKKTKKEVAATPVTVDSSQIVDDGPGSGPESHGKKKKKKLTTKLPSSDPTKDVKGIGPATGSVKKTILKSQKPQAASGAESERKKKKKVTFQLPDQSEFEPSEKELLGEETEFTDLDSTWKSDKLRPGLVYGMYTPEEDGVLKQAVFDYIQEQGWDREEGLKKILNSRTSEAKGCWHVIRKCLPKRELKRIYARAHRILGPNTLLGKWTNEETQALMELHSVHGNNWKRIATLVGRDSEACKDKWRYVKWSKSKDYKIGTWSEEEHQKLCELVFKCLHVKAQMAKNGLIVKTNRMIRDDINWEFIAEQMGGRGRLDCLCQWYRKMASPMVTTGEWSNGDDQRLLERLMEEFPLSEELVEWDSLLDNRSGEVCKKRWEQMQRTLGRGPEVRHQHFLEKLESIMKRFAPHLLDTEYDQKFAEDMQRADADESEDMDV
ncbi:hypothetical protein KC19_4G217400 [Ceratodon purpureus]|uniref:Uncharacterized protein n=1 Tax=Ceratodon purpureus TaxID=3225 RepID=A0A8T0IDS6_CERPU|nr:hypothetical protein KC19_4G217400 [Ceratodon purpureus]